MENDPLCGFVAAKSSMFLFISLFIFTPVQEVAHTQLQQDGSEAKQDEINGQNIPGTQELFITLQVPAGLQHVQPQLLTDPNFALQQVQLVQQVAAQDSQQVHCSDIRRSAREAFSCADCCAKGKRKLEN